MTIERLDMAFRRVLPILVGVVLLLTGISTALSAMDVKTYRALFKEGSSLRRDVFDVYIRGVGEGLGWANVSLQNSNPPREPLFCAPSKLALRAENYKDMIDARIARYAAATPEAEFEKLEVEAILVRALMEAFPCPDAERSKK